VFQRGLPVHLPVGQEHAQRAEQAGHGGHHDAANFQIAGEIERVYRPGAAEAEIVELARVIAAFDRHQTHGLGHQRIGHGTHGACGLSHADAQRFRQMFLHRALRGGDIQLEASLQEGARVDVTQDEVAVGHGRARAAAAVAGRAGIGPGAFRTDAHAAARVDPGDGPPARADGVDVDGGRAHRVGMQQSAMAQLRPPAAYQRHVEGGAAHVTEDRIAELGAVGQAKGRADATGGAGFQQQHRLRRHQLGRGKAAIRLHEQQLAVEARTAQPAAEIGDVARADRAEHGVQHRGAGALILSDLGVHLMRGGEELAGQPLGQEAQRFLLMRRIDEGVQEGDGDGVDIRRRDPVGQPRQLVEVEPGDDVAAIVQPFRHLEAIAARHQRARIVEAEVVQVRPVVPGDAAQFQDVAEALGRDQGRLRAGAFDDHVRSHGRAMADEADGVRGCAGNFQDLAETRDSTDHPVGGRCRDLRGVETAIRFKQDDIGKRAAHIDADAVHWHMPI